MIGPSFADVRFSHRPIEVKRFQTIRRHGVDVARELALRVVPKAARGLALGFGLVQCHGGANERLQRLFINLITLMEIDGTPGAAFEAGVEKA